MFKSFMFKSLWFSTFFFSSLLNAQVLFTENFDNLTVGNLCTDLSGLSPGQNGWFTIAKNKVSNLCSEVLPENNKGNVLKINLNGLNTFSDDNIKVFRNDIGNFWQLRNNNNNILKLSFDIFLLSDNNSNSNYQNSSISIYNENEILVFFNYSSNNVRERITAWLPKNRSLIEPSVDTTKFELLNHIHNTIKPFNERWITAEIFIDYNYSKVYFSIPSMNYVSGHNTFFPLSLTNNFEGGGDGPVKIEFEASQEAVTNVPNIRYDNINLSALNVLPTYILSAEDLLSQKFNLYPNPTNKTLNIINSENILVNQIMVYDVTGKEISDKTFNNESEIQLNVENLANGTYFLNIHTNNGIVIKKFIKR